MGHRIVLIFLFLTFIFFIANTEAQHPHLFFDSSTIPSIKAKASDNSTNVLGFNTKEQWDWIIDIADSVFTEKNFSVTLPDGSGYVYNFTDPLEFPPPSPSWYPVWTGLSRKIEMMFISLSLAYEVTDNSTYLEKLKNYTLSLVNWPQWTDPGYACGLACLDTAHFTTAMSIGYDIVYGNLKQNERNRVRNAIINKGILPLHDSTISMANYHNFFAVLNSALGIAAVSINGEDSRTGEWIDYAANSTLAYFNSNGRDGGTYEGQEYGSYSIDNLMIFVEALKFNNIKNLYSNPLIQDSYRFPIYFITSDGKSMADFGDSTYGVGESWSTSMSLIASRNRNPYAQWYLAKTRALENIGKYAMLGNLFFDNSVIPISPDVYLQSSNDFNDIGHVALRDGWSDGDVLLAFKSGPFLGHTHLDQNSFMLNYKGNWLSTDPGYQDYFNQARNNMSYGTVGHNTVLVDGSFQQQKNGSIEKFYTSGYYDYVLGVAGNVYDNMNQFSRHVLFVKPWYFLVFDDLKSDNPHKYDFLVHMDGSGKMFENSGDFFSRKYDTQLLIRQYSSSALNSNILQYPGAESYGSYLDTKNSANQNDIKFLTLLYPETIIGYDLLSNPGFESYTGKNGVGDYWFGRGKGGLGYNGNYSIDATISHSGAQSQKLYAVLSGDDGYVYQTVPVTGGKTYVLTTWIKTDSVEYAAFAHIWFVDARGGLAGGLLGYADNQTFSGTNDWILTYLTYTAPPTAIEAKIVLEVSGSGTGWFDDVSYKEVTKQTYEPVVYSYPILYNNQVTGLVTESENVSDITIFGLGGDTCYSYSTALGKIDSDADITILRKYDKLDSFAIKNGTILNYNNSMIYQSQTRTNANFIDKSTYYKGLVELQNPQDIKLYFENRITNIYVNGTLLDQNQYSYDPITKTLTMNINF